ncbi:MAG: hypothetical protein K0R50_3689 [Eubacterium sp.]|jgi:major membrane immunogen (membrane-anchored lipoprotein)|nr:hypothetical protein [Eubacterium sp.]
MNRFKILIICIITIVILSGCTYGSFTSVGSIEVNTFSKMSMSYQKFNGYKSTDIHVDEGETVEINADIVTEKGKIGMTIEDEDDKKVYEGTDIPTSNFKVTLDKAGDYKVTVTGDKHKGSYKISWDKSEKK